MDERISLHLPLSDSHLKAFLVVCCHRLAQTVQWTACLDLKQMSASVSSHCVRAGEWRFHHLEERHCNWTLSDRTLLLGEAHSRRANVPTTDKGTEMTSLALISFFIPLQKNNCSTDRISTTGNKSCRFCLGNKKKSFQRDF